MRTGASTTTDRRCVVIESEDQNGDAEERRWRRTALRACASRGGALSNERGGRRLRRYPSVGTWTGDQLLRRERLGRMCRVAAQKRVIATIVDCVSLDNQAMLQRVLLARRLATADCVPGTGAGAVDRDLERDAAVAADAQREAVRTRNHETEAYHADHDRFHSLHGPQHWGPKQRKQVLYSIA